MKFRLLMFVFSAFFVLSVSKVALANENEGSSTVIDYESSQLSNEELFQKALAGELVNNEHTQVYVTVTESDSEQPQGLLSTTEEDKVEITKVEIHKVLSEEAFPNGDVISKGESEVTLLAAGSLSEDKYPASSSVGVRIKLDYDGQSLGGFSTRKLTRYTVTPLRSDIAFSMTSLEYQAANFGTGWKADGTMYVASEYMPKQQITSIVYNSPMSHTTNFVKYTPINSDVIASSGVTGKFSYRRGSGSILTHQFDLSW
ncbi:hypothetical protein [Lysinibacillus sp. TE18511]